jgi:hypothetical protein
VELIGPYLVGCILLVVAGAMKAARPDDTARALAPRLPVRLRPSLSFGRLRTVIRTAAGVEAGLGLVGLVLPRPLVAGVVAATYLAFAAVIGYLRLQGGALASCGCFGTPDTPATFLHVAVDLVLAAAGFTVAMHAPSSGSMLTVLNHGPLHGVPLALATGVGAWLTYLTLSVLAALQAVRRTVAAGGARA